MVEKRDLIQLFRPAGWRARLYLGLKLKICPLLALEAHVPDRGQIVDLGCGNGLFGFILKLGSPLREIIGLDLDDKKLSLAQKIQQGRRLCQFLLADLNQLDFPSAHIYTLVDVLYLLPPSLQLKILKRCYELLPPGGYILIKEIDTRPRWKYLWNYFQETLSVRVVGFTRGKRFSFRSSAEWASLLKELGCHVNIIPLHKGYCYSHVLITGQK